MGWTSLGWPEGEVKRVGMSRKQIDGKGYCNALNDETQNPRRDIR
jgi:hypothetical protein